MPEAAISEYFYGDEAEQFIYFRIPRQLITDPRFKHLSTDAKLLYGVSSLSDLSDADLFSLADGWEPELPDDFFTYHIQGQTIQIKDQKLGQALSGLLPRDREIILLYYFLGLRDEAVAKRLNMSRATVQRRREKAQKKLKTILEESL